MAKSNPPAQATPPATPDLVKVRVLADGSYGRVNEVITVPADAVESMKNLGLVDDNADSVAYAESLLAPVDEPVLGEQS